MSIEKKLTAVNKKFSDIIRNEENSEDIQKLREERRKIDNRIIRKQRSQDIRLNKIKRQKSLELFKTALEEYPFSIIYEDIKHNSLYDISDIFNKMIVLQELIELKLKKLDDRYIPLSMAQIGYDTNEREYVFDEDEEE